MLEKQINELSRILVDEDIQQYAADGFWNLIQAVVFSDPFAGVEAGKKIKELVFHIPTLFFWDKMKRFLYGTFFAYEDQIKLAKKFGFDKFFVNIAKTQFSFSADKDLLGAPKDFEFEITDIELRSGAQMIVAIAGNMLLMPGLGKKSNYLNMSVDGSGHIEGLF